MVKKYDKVETNSSSISESDSTASSYSKTIDTYKLNNNHRIVQNEVKTFYLKQQSPSPLGKQNLNEKVSKKKLNYDHTLSITSNESSLVVDDNVCILKEKKDDKKLNDLSYNIKVNEELENAVLARVDSVRYTKKKKRLTDETKNNEMIQLQEKVSVNNETGTKPINNLSAKDCSEMYALEHTVI